MSSGTELLTDERKHDIRVIVSSIIEVEPDDIGWTSSFKDEHGADSLRAIEVLAALEKTFDIEIDQSELASMQNLRDTCSVVARAAGWHEIGIDSQESR